VHTCVLSRVQLFATLWTIARQTPSMGFSRQEYWSGLPLPSLHRLYSTGSTAVVHGLSCSGLSVIFPDQGSNLCLLH